MNDILDNEGLGGITKMKRSNLLLQFLLNWNISLHVFVCTSDSFDTFFHCGKMLQSQADCDPDWFLSFVEIVEEKRVRKVRKLSAGFGGWSELREGH